MENKSVKCKKCGWVHFQVSAAYIKQWKADWVTHWNNMTEEGRGNYGLKDGPPTEKEYMNCFRCGGSYKEFLDAEPKDVPNGSTIQPIMNRDEIYEN